MACSQPPILDTLTGPTNAGIELLLRQRLRLARRIVEDELNSSSGEVVAAVFEQLCYRCDGQNDQMAH